VRERHIVTVDATDEELMLAFRAGDARAFELLVQRHRAPVFNFILRFAGQRARAEDILQETWLKVVRGAVSYEAKAKFTTWLYTVARNLCVDSSRKESYRQTDSLDAQDQVDGQAPIERAADGHVNPERDAHHARVRPLLEKALAALPAEQREVFVLREYSGIPFKDIAHVTGVPENTVKSRMRYALEGLRRSLLQLGVDGVWTEPERTAAG
jgi:RNA polymerase sigma-70 factor (ECF subfamily)